MNYFRTDISLSIDRESVVYGAVARHIRDSRRMRSGDEIVVQDIHERRFVALITRIDTRTITIMPRAEVSLPEKPTRQITLLQALISEQNIDLILQKTTELGITEIILFGAERSPNPLKSERMEHKLSRWEQIMVAACEQSGRVELPTFAITSSLDEALTHTKGQLILLDEHGSSVSTDIHQMTIVVGPEGGLTDMERTMALERGAHQFSIGTYTLRSETAAIAGTARLI